MGTRGRRLVKVVAGALAMLLSPGSAGAEAPSDAGETADVERAVEELYLLARTLRKTRRDSGWASFLEARRAAGARFASWPPAVRSRAIRRLLHRRYVQPMEKEEIVDLLVKCGELGVDFAREVMAWVRDEDKDSLLRGNMMAVLLCTGLRDVAPRDELVRLAKDAVAKGHPNVRAKTLYYCWLLDDPSVIREIVRVAQETDEPSIRGPARAGLRRCQNIPADLREAVDDLIGRRGAPGEEAVPPGPSKPSTEATSSSEKRAASQGHGMTPYVAAGLVCAAVSVAALVVRRLMKGRENGNHPGASPGA